MDKLKMTLIIIACFIIGMGVGIKQEPQNLKANTIEKEIAVYEAQVDEPDELFIPLGEREVTTESTPLQHNNISKFGNEAGEMIKVGVRETLRYCIILIDQLISE